MISTAQAKVLDALDQGWTLVFWDPTSRDLFALYHEDGTRLGVSAVTGRSLVQRKLVERDPDLSEEQALEWNLPPFVVGYQLSEFGRQELTRSKETRV